MTTPPLDLAVADATAPPATSSLCTVCNLHPRLGSLTRCKGCIRDAAAADRQARTEAEARVAAREKSITVSVIDSEQPETKRCGTCGRDKALHLFHKHRLGKQGRRKHCITCVRAGRGVRQPRTAEQLARAKAKAAEPANRRANRAAVADWSLRHPLASRAREIVRRALLRGDVVPPPVCQVEGCGDERLVGHHASYNRPLQVLFICRRHHKLLHNGVGLVLRAGVPPSLKRLPKSVSKDMTEEKAKDNVVPNVELERRRGERAEKKARAKAKANSILEEDANAS